LFNLRNYSKFHNISSKILAKLEFYNPTGSIKDRVAKYMIEDAEKNCFLKPGYTIIEPTSGNTGISLAAISAIRGYKIILTMPDTMSVERRNLISIYGAELVLTDGILGMKGSIIKAKELASKIDNSFIPNQFVNKANPSIHFKTTGPEIWNDTDGNIDILVVGVGSGGTLTGVGNFLKSKNSNVKIIAVEPSGSCIDLTKNSSEHKIQGLVKGFVSEVFDIKLCDEIIYVSDEDAFNCVRDIAKIEGLLVGISSGAALYAATKISNRSENINKTIVVIFPDTGERYLSTETFVS
jgi:cysteine synthase A